jgi:hypothetical protein
MKQAAAGRRGQSAAGASGEHFSRARGHYQKLRGDEQEAPADRGASIDALMAYMLQKARSFHIDLDLSVSAVSGILSRMLSTKPTSTPCWPICSTMPLSRRSSAKKSIFCRLYGICDHYYRIDVFDSGAPFSPETLSEAV